MTKTDAFPPSPFPSEMATPVVAGIASAGLLAAAAVFSLLMAGRTVAGLVSRRSR